jgi:hypothetical protein
MRSAASARCRVAGVLSAIVASRAKLCLIYVGPIRQASTGGFPPLLSGGRIGLAFPWRDKSLGIQRLPEFNPWAAGRGDPSRHTLACILDAPPLVIIIRWQPTRKAARGSVLTVTAIIWQNSNV